MAEQILRDLDSFEKALTRPRVLLFKHSPICPISIAARAEFKRFQVDHDDVPTLIVDVVSAHAVARGIASAAGIAHESPQAILFEQGRATWHASHAAITKDALEAAWAPHC